MKVTFSKEKVDALIAEDNPKRIIDLGDLNGKVDLTQIILFVGDISDWVYRFDMAVDIDTTNNLRSITGSFSWLAIYNGWLAKHHLVKTGGILYTENKKTGTYYTQDFYNNFIKVAGYELLDLEDDGKTVYATLRKTDDRFPSLEQFSELGIQQS